MSAPGSLTWRRGDQQLGRLGRAAEQPGMSGAPGAHAATAWSAGGTDEQFVEDGHPHDDAGLHLLADQGLRGVDRIGGELDAAVDRPGVHQQLPGAQPAGRHLVPRRVLAQRGT